MNKPTYECSICFHVNHASHFSCSTCGTIPSHYSAIGSPSRLVTTETGTKLIPVVSARGAEHAEHHHTRRIYMRTVPLDYYSSGKDTDR